MKDLTQYSEQELTLLVMNDEQLYKQAMQVKSLIQEDDFIDELKEQFIFTDEQEQELRQDLRDGESVL
jgi:hypothetical protein